MLKETKFIRHSFPVAVYTAFRAQSRCTINAYRFSYIKFLQRIIIQSVENVQPILRNLRITSGSEWISNGLENEGYTVCRTWWNTLFFLKFYHQVLTPILCTIGMNYLKPRIFPEILRSPRLLPVPKSGNRGDVFTTEHFHLSYIFETLKKSRINFCRSSLSTLSFQINMTKSGRTMHANPATFMSTAYQVVCDRSVKGFFS